MTVEKAAHSYHSVHSLGRQVSALFDHEHSTFPDLEIIHLNKQGIPLEKRYNVLQAV